MPEPAAPPPVTCRTCPWWLRAGPTTPDGYCRRRVTLDVRGRHYVWPATPAAQTCALQEEDGAGGPPT